MNFSTILYPPSHWTYHTSGHASRVTVTVGRSASPQPFVYRPSLSFVPYSLSAPSPSFLFFSASLESLQRVMQVTKENPRLALFGCYCCDHSVGYIAALRTLS
ncbi:hypothetical protein M378DRAFT_551616 [Amanita muscaria Koide BX008]|uniref:Uncharacterized protein n=1 Tax=Amanita muscaria (strain Koide BX008) TaxID=946122 RepID=A0A0C2SPJ4_AMAMK|nr:hypothetical protein M378DRAFT_551616 [Amanita muscaria Koide BX008]